MEIRVLGPDDVAHMRDLLVLFGRAFEDGESYTASQPDDTYLSNFLGNRNNIVLVAFMEDLLVGGLVAFVLPRFGTAGCEVYLYDLGVDERFRRRGCARRLIERLNSIAVQLGAHTVYVQAHSEDTAAVALYSRLGVSQEVLHFDLMPNQSHHHQSEQLDNSNHER